MPISEALLREAAVLGSIDAVLVTAMIDAREIFEAAVVAFGPEPVHVPELLRLRIRPRQEEPGAGANEGGDR